MTFKEFGEDAKIEYSLQVFVNDEQAITIMALSEESLLEQLRKADHAIKQQLTEQFETLPESEEL